MTAFEQKLLDYLVKAKLLTSVQAQSIVQKSQRYQISIEALLERDTKLAEEKILQAKSKLSGEAAVNLPESISIPLEVLKLIPEDVVRRYRVIPLEKKGSELVVGIVDPEDIQAREALRFLMLRQNLTASVVVVSEGDFNRAIIKYQDVREEISRALSDLEQTLKDTGRPRVVGLTEAAEVIKEAPITKVVAVILKHATEGRASDIHIEPTRTETRVRFRVDGTLHTSLILPSAIHSAVVARVKILSGMRLDESRIPQDGRFRARIDNAEVDFRVSTFPTTLGEKVVLRVLDTTAVLQDLEGIGLVGVNKEKMLEAIHLPFGLILLSGPTGSGKSTTLYSLINLLPKEKMNIVTIEDPVEYFIEGVSQSEIKPEIGYTFASGLRNILRQDPDVIMVGEVRDKETAQLVTHASLTGHIVFSTIHTNNAIGVIPRLIDMGVDNFLVPSSLAAAAAQRLIRRVCDSCKHAEDPSPQIAKIIKTEMEKIPPAVRKQYEVEGLSKVWVGEGCPECAKKGYKGRVAIFEVLRMTKELQRLIYSGGSEEAIVAESQRQGMITILQDGIIKALKGYVSVEDVIRATKES